MARTIGYIPEPKDKTKAADAAKDEPKDKTKE
jgi:hypothetical protein